MLSAQKVIAAARGVVHSRWGAARVPGPWQADIEQEWTHELNTEGTSAVPPDPARSAAYADATIVVWRRVAWVAALEYIIGSPSLVLIPAGSTLRGVVLAGIPALAALVCFVGLKRPTWRGGREMLVPATLVAVVLWQSLATAMTLGSGYVQHVVPAVCLLALALRVRPTLYHMSMEDYRRCLAVLVPPFTLVPALGLIVQLLKPAISGDPSSLPIAVKGARLMGLAVHPVAFGLLTGLTLLIAVVARGEPSRMRLYRIALVILLILSNARTAYLGTVAALIILWLLEPSRSLGRRLIPLLATAAVMPVFLQFILVARSANAGGVLTGRDLIWKNTLGLLRHVGVFGYGPNAIVRLFPTVGGKYSTITQAQNQWLNDAIGFGWTSSVLLALLVVALLLAGPLAARRLLLWPMLAYVVFVSFSEQPLDLWNSTVQAYPLFLCLLVSSRGRRSILSRSRSDRLEDWVRPEEAFR